MDCTSTWPETANGLTAGLADKINAEYRASIAAANTAIDHAMRCGDLLIEAKATCHHGEWNNWLAENFNGSGRTARNYMRLAEHRLLVEAKRQSVADLGIGTAMRLLASPRDDHRYPPATDDPRIFEADPIAWERMSERHERYWENAQEYFRGCKEVINSIQPIPGGAGEFEAFEALEPLAEIIRESLLIENGWAAWKLKNERAIGSLLNEAGADE